MKLAYDEFGSGARTLVLLHGFPLGRAMWTEVARDLGTSARVIVPDLRGHGGSPSPAGPYTMDALADDVLELADHCGLTQPFDLGGLSMGGYVALAFAAVHPQRLSSLILCDTRATADTAEAAAGRETLAAKVESSDSVEPVVEAFLPKLLALSAYDEKPDLVAKVRAMMAQQPATGVAGCLRAMARRADHSGLLKTLDFPILALVGEADRITPPDDARAMSASARRGTLEVIDGAGHLTSLEAPAATADAIRRFLQSIS